MSNSWKLLWLVVDSVYVGSMLFGGHATLLQLSLEHRSVIVPFVVACSREAWAPV